MKLYHLVLNHPCGGRTDMWYEEQDREKMLEKAQSCQRDGFYGDWTLEEYDSIVKVRQGVVRKIIQKEDIPKILEW